ncbi:cupredoxin domain-containing protein [Zhongshania sp. CAU 1632]|uniref:Cupredoxin domain-containing protein n=2 Tax=Zhongshania aquimaris TaxID=2857107 RepID=A0ABS6VTY0_9GAMM|nr:cupredoxin domain-containing protein [Zhongshania aquimaris]MBW2941200.1 cupredoxin domain-containing protein [Zhongshania aquimaris]
MTAAFRLVLFAVSVLFYMPAIAGKPEFEVAIRQHLFEPSVIVIPANTKIKLWVSNEDTTPEEFESYELNREKVVLGGQRSLIFIGPLPAGEYPFFGEFNPKSAQGKIIAE